MCKHTIAIVEPRDHQLLSKTIDNALQHSTKDWCVQVFHGKSQDVQKLPRHARLSYHSLETDNLLAHDYNALFLTPDFWDRMRGDGKVLIMQTDSAFCGNAKSPALDSIPAYGFIGCSSTVTAWGGVCRGIGGFSLRDKSTMQACARSTDKHHAEDVYFAECGLEQAKKHPQTSKRMPKTDREMLDFCVEYVGEIGVKHADLRPPLGVHVSGISSQTWDYVLRTCPAAQHLRALR